MSTFLLVPYEIGVRVDNLKNPEKSGDTIPIPSIKNRLQPTGLS